MVYDGVLGKISRLFGCMRLSQKTRDSNIAMGNWLIKSTKCNICPRLQMSSVSSLVSSSEDEADYEHESVYGQLKLPWHENYWNIKVTHVVSPNEVWATLTKNAVNKLNWNL